MEWLDDVKQWKAGDASATERLREYVTPFVHGALLARMPHHLANALMAEALDTVLVSPEQVTKDSHFVTHAVAVARKLVKRTKPASLQERPSSDTTVAEGRQWLERLRALPEEVRERALWRLCEGIPGPELVEVLSLDEEQLKAELERGIGDTLVPAQSLAGAEYVWDLSGEPSTALARAETYAMSLRFDPLATPEPADVVNTAATFQDLSNAKVGEVRPEANPFGDFAPTRVQPSEAKGAKLQPANTFTDEKTQGAFDLPAAARGLVPKTEPAAPAVKTSGRQALVPPTPTQRSEPKVPKVFEDDRPSRKRPVLADERPSRKSTVPMNDGVGRRETMEAPIEPKPSQTRLDDDERPSRKTVPLNETLGRQSEHDEERPSRKTVPLNEAPGRQSTEHDDERPSRSKLQVRGKLDRPEESGRRRNPELEHKRRPVVTEPEAPGLSGVTPIGPVSESSIEPTDPEAERPVRSTQQAPMPNITEKLMPQPLNAGMRYVAIGVGGMLLLLAILWRLRVF